MHGTVNSAFLLANSIRYDDARDVESWVSSARGRSSFLAAAVDHRPVARLLIETGLVVSGDGLHLSGTLRALSARADRPTLVSLAALILELAPPAWLGLVASEEGLVRYELIPSSDLARLEWLRPELDQILLDAGRRQGARTSNLALGIGRAAELVIVAALDAVGLCPIHVSELSDRFGYDVEAASGGIRRWEVKGSTRRTSGTFHLSRNEFEKCRVYGAEWGLVQVEFEDSALTATTLKACDIGRIRELSWSRLISLADTDTETFVWEESARISPGAMEWSPSSLKIPADLQLPSLGALGTEAAEARRLLRSHAN